MKVGGKRLLLAGAGVVTLVLGVSLLGSRGWYGETAETSAERQVRDAATRKEQEAPVLPGPPLRFAPADRQDLAYGFAMDADAEIDILAAIPAAWSEAAGTEQKGMAPVKLATTGTLALRYYDVGSGQWDVAARILDPTYDLNGQRPLFASALGYPFAFRMDARGHLSEFRFARGTPAGAQSAMQSILQAAQMILPEQGRARWETKEADAVGTYAASYELTGGGGKPADVLDIVKTKERYVETHAAGLGLNGLVKQTVAEVGDARARATVRRGGAWILDVQQQERLAQRARGETLSQGESRLRMWRLEGVKADFPESFAAFDAELKSGKYIQEQLYATNPELNEMSDGLDLVGAVGKYQELKKANKRRLAQEFLINFLRQDRANAERLVAALIADSDHAEYDDETQLELWLMVVKAGYPEAQQAIWGAVTDTNNADQARIRAMAYISDVEYPEPQLVDQVWESYTRSQATEDGTERDLKAMSILALGVLGDREKLNDDVKPVIAQRLVEALRGANNPWDEEMALLAIGNSGNAEALDAVAPSFRSDNAGVRAAAFSSLRKMEDPRAQMVFIHQYQEERSTSVRVAALRALAQMPLVPQALDWVRERALATTDEKEQIALVNVLGKTLPADRHNEITLRQILTTKAPTTVRQTVFRYVSP